MSRSAALQDDELFIFGNFKSFPFNEMRGKRKGKQKGRNEPRRSLVRSLAECVGDEGFAVEVVGGVEGLVAGSFERGYRGVEFAGSDLFCGGVGVAELAGGEMAVFGARGWAEGPAEDGARFVEIAGAGVGVEHRAGLVVGELFPPQRARTARWRPRFKEGGGLLVFKEDSGGAVAWEPGV